MPDIRLQDYVARVKDLISSDRHDEAIAHCQHILKHYPKHVDTYRLMGEACLEKEMFRESIEFFQRTLGADPESFIARVGLGIIYDGQGTLDEAVWQMERAFDLEPGNPEVRRELQRLYAQRDGKEKPRLRLTRGALGRLYTRNGLYERAITEFRSVLHQNPSLPDVRVALVEALWHEGRRLEAVEVCLELLDSLPNCLKANLILAEIWMRGGHEDASQEKLNLVRALDPVGLVAQEMMGLDSPLPQEEVMLPFLDYKPSMPIVSTTVDATAPVLWGTDATDTVVGAQASESLVADEGWEAGDPLPDWLQDIGVDTLDDPVSTIEAGVPDEPAASGKQVPDWLMALTGEDLNSVEESGQPVPTPESQAGDASADEGASDWMSTLVAPAAAAVAAAVVVGHDRQDDETEPTADLSELESVPEEDVPDWLSELGEPAVKDDAVLAEDVPDWLSELGGPTVKDDSAIIAPVPEGQAVPAEDVPDWLNELRGPAVEDDAVAVEPVAEEAAVPAEDVPDWLSELGGPAVEDGAAVIEPVAEEAAVPAEDVPDWLSELGGPAVEDDAAVVEPVAEEAAVPAEDMPDWLSELGGPAVEDDVAVVEPVAEEAAAPAEAEPAEDVPDWLLSLGAAAAGAAVIGRDRKDDQAGIGADAPEAEAVPEQDQPDDVPDLDVQLPAEGTDAPDVETQVMEDAPSVESVSADDTPDWLRDLKVPVVGAAAATAAVSLLHESDVQEPPLDEADLDAAIAEMSADELASQQDEEVPPWLEELMAGEDAPAAVASDGLPLDDVPVPDEPDSVFESAVEDDVPDWLRTLDAPEAEEVVSEVGPPAGEIVPEFEEDVPDWLRDLDEPVAEEIVSEVEIPSPGAAAETEDDVPDWLRALDVPEAEETVSELEIPSSDAVTELEEDVPDRLRDLGDPVAEEIVSEVEIPSPDAAAELEEDVPDWLRALDVPEAEEAVSELETPSSDVVAALEEDVPDWLRDLDEPAAEEIVSEVGISEPEAAAEVEEDAPDWLRALDVPEAEETVSELEIPSSDAVAALEEDVPDWLQALDVPETEEAVPELEIPSTEAAAGLEEDVPDWLRDLDEPAAEEVASGVEVLASEAAPELEEDLPDWLRDLDESVEAKVAATAGVAFDGEQLPEPVIPDSEQVPEADIALAEDIPGWLGELDETTEEDSVVQAAKPETEAPAEAPEVETTTASEEGVSDWLHDLGVPVAGAAVAAAALSLADKDSGEEVPVAGEAAVPAPEVPESLRALVDAGILDEADLETAMAEMSAEDLEAQQAEEVPAWLQDLMEDEPAAPTEPAATPILAEEVPVEEVIPEAEGTPAEEVIAEVEVPEAVEEAEAVPSDEMPDWLRELDEPLAEGTPAEEVIAEVEVPEAAEEAEVVPSDDVPDWVRKLDEPEPEAVAPTAHTPSMGAAAPDVEAIPQSLQALVAAGILDEADLEAAMSEMSEEDIASQRAEQVPGWLQELMGDDEPSAVAEALEELVEPAAVDEPDLVVPVEEAPAIQIGDAKDLAEEPLVESGEAVAIPDVDPPLAEKTAVPDWLRELEEPVGDVVIPVVEPVDDEPVADTLVLPTEELLADTIVPEAEEVEEGLPEAEAPAEVVEAVPVVEQAEPQEVPTAEEPRLERDAGDDIPDVEVPEEKEAEVAPPPVQVQEEAAAPSLSQLEELESDLKARPRDHKTRLELARAYGENQDWDAALDQYEKLVATRKFLPAVADELQALSGEDVDRPRLFQILGDAYMQDGNLDAALDMYRQAREALVRR